MSTVATTPHTIELALAHANTLGRVIVGAYEVGVTRFGEVRMQGDAESLSEAPVTLGLVRVPRMDHASNGHVFRTWQGHTTSAFGTFETTVVLVEKGHYLGHRFEVSTIDNGPECIHCHTFANHAAPGEACRVRDAKAIAAVEAERDSVD